MKPDGYHVSTVPVLFVIVFNLFNLQEIQQAMINCAKFD